MRTIFRIFTAFIIIAAIGISLTAGGQKEMQKTPANDMVQGQSEQPGMAALPPGTEPGMYKNPPEETLRQKLTEDQFYITQQAGTEPPFKNEFWDNHREGIYVDIVSGEPLFSSTDKFKSGTGWPSFTRPINSGNVTEHRDSSFGMTRVEVRSFYSDSHLGHLFNDGPAPTGLRYCINSAALRFIPREKLAEEGYGEYLPLFGGDTEVAVLAGGCFWGVEAVFESLTGVENVRSGYSGGKEETAKYMTVGTGTTGHAEAVEIIFDPQQISYRKLLEVFFTVAHDPTQLNYQGPDHGTQYRSAIFYTSSEQKKVAEEKISQLEKDKSFPEMIVTEVTPLDKFYPAEEYHQDFLKLNPSHPYIVYWDLPKLEHLNKEFPDLIGKK